MTTKPPYEEPLTISYVKDANGRILRVRSAEVKPYRRHELRLLAQGAAIVYHGYARGDAQPEIAEMEDDKLASKQKIRPLWSMYRTYEKPANKEIA